MSDVNFNWASVESYDWANLGTIGDHNAEKLKSILSGLGYACQGQEVSKMKKPDLVAAVAAVAARAAAGKNVKKAQSGEQTSCPWLLAAGYSRGFMYSKAFSSCWHHQSLLDAWTWPSVLLSGEPIFFRSISGLRTSQAEELVQMWRQICHATEEESLKLLVALEDVSAHLIGKRLADGSAVRPDSFFLQHRERFMRTQAICGEVEDRLLRAVDPIVARQVATRHRIGELPISAASLDVAARARLDLSSLNKRDRSRSRTRGSHQDKRGPHREGLSSAKICKYCDVKVDGSIFHHFKVCTKAPSRSGSKVGKD